MSENNKVENKENVLGILGIILSFMVPIAGLVLSILGLNKSKQLNGKGKTISIIGIVVSAVRIFLTIICAFIFIIFIGAFSFEAIDRIIDNVDDFSIPGTVLNSPIGSNGYYTLKLPNDTVGVKYEYNLKDGDKVYITMDEEENSFSIDFGNFTLKDYDTLNIGEIKIFKLDNYYFYTNISGTNIREESVSVFENGNLVKTIYELDEDPGMVPASISFSENGIEIVGTRLEHDFGIVANGGSFHDLANLCDKNTWKAYNVTKNTIVGAKYSFNYDDEMLLLTPKITNQVIVDEEYKNSCN